MHKACETGDIKFVTDFISTNPELTHHQDFKVDEKKTPLHIAATHGCLDICKLLISHATYVVDICDAYGTTPLLYAIAEGHIEICDLLLINNASPNVRPFCAPNAFQSMEKPRKDILSLLIKHGFDINSKYRRINTSLRCTLLDEYAKKGDEHTCNLLITNGATSYSQADIHPNIDMSIFTPLSNVYKNIICNLNFRQSLFDLLQPTYFPKDMSTIIIEYLDLVPDELSNFIKMLK
jgi:ankyrin repeat protein